MKFFRQFRQFVSCALLALALFSQGAIAVTACISTERCAVQAYVAAPCEHHDSMNPNLCLAHSMAHDQSFDGVAVTPAIPSMDLSSGLTVPAVATVLPRAARTASETRLVGASPPRSILFCSFRI